MTAIQQTIEPSSPPKNRDSRDHTLDGNGSQTKRRKKDDADRTRVSRACDRCKRKKTRCSGRQPCTLCTSGNLSCEFTAAYTRGRLPSILPDDNVDSRPTFGPGSMLPAPLNTSQVSEGAGIDCEAEAFSLTGLLGNAVDSQHVNPSEHQSATEMGHLQPAIISRADSRVQSSRNSPEPSQTDLQGHYVGPSSGVSFLLRVQKRFHQKVSFSLNSSIFTFGDAPLPEFDPSFFVLPPKADAQILVGRYFDFAVPTHRFLHRPTVEAWLEEFYENLGVMRQKDGARERTALLFMVFAQAKEYMPNLPGSNTVDTSARYFQAADHQLSTETGEIRLTSVQARLCQCFYLLSQSRVNHCWSLFGTTAHLILAIGIHRKRRVELSNGVDLVELECRKRVFWCVYSLDNYLSAALGRPRTFHDDDIDQELPTCVNDSDLTPQSIRINNSKAQSIMMAPVAHNMLSKIISHILHDLYPLRSPSMAVRITLASKCSQELLNWRKNLSRFLDADGLDTSLLMPLFQRQRNVLNLAYYHALILVHRPFLLSNFASLNSRNGRSYGAPGTPDMNKNVADCLDAALNITFIVDELTEGQQIFRAFWFTHYFAFSAVVVLYIYTIQQSHAPEHKYQTYFNAAAKCQSQMSSIAEKESLAQRYSVVLEELRLEAVKHIQRHQDSQNANSELISTVLPNSLVPQAVMQQVQPNDMNPSDQPGFPPQDELMAELTSWGEFDALVTAGIGGLDFLFMGDQNPLYPGYVSNEVEEMMSS